MNELLVMIELLVVILAVQFMYKIELSTEHWPPTIDNIRACRKCHDNQATYQEEASTSLLSSLLIC